jgi:hypothetical protein
MIKRRGRQLVDCAQTGAGRSLIGPLLGANPMTLEREREQRMS